jgi:hypothetical protein
VTSVLRKSAFALVVSFVVMSQQADRSLHVHLKSPLHLLKLPRVVPLPHLLQQPLQPLLPLVPQHRFQPLVPPQQHPFARQHPPPNPRLRLLLHVPRHLVHLRRRLHAYTFLHLRQRPFPLPLPLQHLRRLSLRKSPSLRKFQRTNPQKTLL